jgi:hypothetical protein
MLPALGSAAAKAEEGGGEENGDTPIIRDELKHEEATGTGNGVGGYGEEYEGVEGMEGMRGY